MRILYVYIFFIYFYVILFTIVNSHSRKALSNLMLHKRVYRVIFCGCCNSKEFHFIMYINLLAAHVLVSVSHRSLSCTEQRTNHIIDFYQESETNKKSEVAKNSQIFLKISFYSVFFAHTHLSLLNYGFVAKNSNFIELRHNCFFSISIRF